MTAATVGGSIDLTFVRATDSPDLGTFDIVLVQRASLVDLRHAEDLVQKARLGRKPIVLDLDDAFHLIDETHPEFDRYNGRVAALTYIISEADQVWFSTEKLAEECSRFTRRRYVVRNALDPRLWGSHPEPRPAIGSSAKVHFLYMGTATHDEDFKSVLPAFNALAGERPDNFDVSIIGAVRNLPKVDWIKNLGVPAEARAYPDFVRWLRNQGPFDVGIAPLVNNAFNQFKSDLKFLEYIGLGVLPVLSDFGPYSALRSLANGRLPIARSLDEWQNYLLQIVRHPENYKAIVDECQSYVWSMRTVEGVGRLQVELLSSLLESA
jgi:glycosyltransferase involved in cell wall biosynthesis